MGPEEPIEMEEEYELDQTRIEKLELLHSKLAQLLEVFGEFLRIDDTSKWYTFFLLRLSIVMS